MSGAQGLADLLAEAARRFPDKVALVAGEQRVRYGELASDVWALSRWWRSAGLQRGDRVLVFASNSAQAAVAFWAIVLCGGVVVMVNPGTRPEKLAWLLADSGAGGLIAEAGLADAWVPAAARSPALRQLVVIGTLPAQSACGMASVTRFEDALAAGSTLRSPVEARGSSLRSRAEEPRASTARERRAEARDPSARERGVEAPRDPHELAALIYTSGSTGEPKAVMLTHRNMLAAARSIASYLGLVADDVLLGVLPLSFDYGLYQLILSVSVGARLVLERSFSLPGQVLHRIARERVTVLPGVPTLFAMLARLGDLQRWDLSSIRSVTSTAAALGPEQVRWLESTFPRAQLFSMYGLTECKRCSYLPPADLARKPGSVGIAIPGNELWLVDDEDRRLGPDLVGQLVVRGPTVMAGYWQRPEETAQRLRPGPLPGELVLYTGDLCRMDDEGYLYFVRRMDDIIKSRGEKVAPAEVEAALCSLPGVLEAALVGVPDELLGQALRAFVTLEPHSTWSAGALRAACRELLTPFMVPHEVVVVLELPRTANGKIEKGSLV